jgi:hypothetical protein
VSFLTADQIAGILVPTESVEVAGVGVFNVRGLTAKETESLEGRKDVATRLLLLGLVDGEGKRLFSEDKSEVVAKLPQKIAKPIQEAVMRLSGMSANAVSDAEKKSPATANSSSGSEQPESGDAP